MNGIEDPDLRALAEEWSPLVMELLDALGRAVWPPKKFRRWLLDKPQTLMRYMLEGPARQGDSVVWALSHTSRPSSFDYYGRLTPGERHTWVIRLSPGSQPEFTVEGAQTHDHVPADRDALRAALDAAKSAGPRVQTFYGNKGPLSQSQGSS